jgi:hypothetical protein
MAIMTAHILPRRSPLRGKAGLRLVLGLGLSALLVLGAGTFVSFVLWPTWSGAAVALDAPAIPVTVAGVLLDVPPAAIRIAVQRQPGPHERLDLAFLWPSLAPPQAEAKAPDSPSVQLAGTVAPTPPDASARLFMTVAGLGTELPPAERLRSIYPHYIEAEAAAGPDGLAVVAFRAGSPYDGEDLVYLGANPEQFFARCTRAVRAVPGTCLQQRLLGAAEITFRFPRNWLDDWRGTAAGFDKLVTSLHP